MRDPGNEVVHNEEQERDYHVMNHKNVFLLCIFVYSIIKT